MPPLLEARGISKSFPGVRALQNVSMHVEAAETLAVCGENGAGKSTLMKILGGVQTPDAGEIHLQGRPIALNTVKDAERAGIVLIHQELNLADDLDVASNIFLGREPTWGGPLGFLSSRIYDDAAALMQRLGLDCSPRARVRDLPVGQQQLVEIARSLSLQSRILILDEPTSSLTDRETERLFRVLRELKRDGLALIYISHRLREIEEIADRVTVLRDGQNAGELFRGGQSSAFDAVSAKPLAGDHGNDIVHENIVRLMVGRELKQFFQRSRHVPEGLPVLSVRDVRWSAKQKAGISFDLRGGEIVGMSGLMGAGRTELADTIFGARPRITGSLILDGLPVNIRTPRHAIDRGIFLAPEDRRTEGLILADSVQQNISLPTLAKISHGGLLSFREESALAKRMIEMMRVRTPSPDQAVGLLSGGNQQKVVLAKWLQMRPRVLILDEPTRGIDVGAKSEIYALMDQLAGEGVAVLMISSDLEEILGMSDRVLVMHEGALAGELARDQLSEEAIMRLATGGDRR
ncbi:MAG: sugar ABC transporter ATP-binding protein [Gemmataceae bacterium]|nr:sugar ABC transporter ATP-binding protein [Gemmataceae bacterium]